MTRGRSYQPRMTGDAALAELERLAGSQFDARCVAALRRTTATPHAQAA
jgi:HD-GYP domain-containing protein (c-di-GMP phosphodiesterase class II)